jgi:hypothetical protein
MTLATGVIRMRFTTRRSSTARQSRPGLTTRANPTTLSAPPRISLRRGFLGFPLPDLVADPQPSRRRGHLGALVVVMRLGRPEPAALEPRCGWKGALQAAARRVTCRRSGSPADLSPRATRWSGSPMAPGGARRVGPDMAALDARHLVNCPSDGLSGTIGLFPSSQLGIYSVLVPRAETQALVFGRLARALEQGKLWSGGV